MKVSDLALFLNAEVEGNHDLEINKIAKIGEAENGDLTFLYLDSYANHLATTKASAVLTNNKIERTRKDLTYIIHPNPHYAFVQIVTKFFDIHPNLAQTKLIDESSQIAEQVQIGLNVVIGKNVKIGKGTIISHNSVVLENSQIGENCIIYPNVSIREYSIIGNNVIIHSNTVIGSDGFGFIPDANGVYQKIPQIGNVIIEDNVELGSNVSIDRAALGSTIIRKGVKIDNLVQIAHNVEIGENTVLSGQTGISGSTKVGKNVILAGQVGVAGHLQIADNVIVAAKGGVSKSITQPGKYYGVPVKDMGLGLRLEGHIRNLPNYLERIKELEKKITELTSKIDDLRK